MTWTTFADVTDRWVGNDAPTDETLVESLIEDAEAVVLVEYPKIQDRITAGTLPLRLVKMVVTAMVSRVLRNPENLTYWQQQTGPFGQARNYGSSVVGMSMSDDEKSLLAPKKRGKAYEVNLAPGAGVSEPFQWFENEDGFQQGL